MHGSAGVVCAIFLSVFELLFVSEARPGEQPTKAGGPAPTSERSIHRALTEGPPNRAKLLLDRGANIDARNAQGATPLITASGQGNIALVTLLLDHRARIDAADREGNTALHEASFYGHVRCVEALLAAGAQPSTRNALKFTPLHQAVRRFWEISGESSDDRLTRQADVIALLLQYGADPDLRDGSGRTPAVLAVESMNDALRQAFNPLPRMTTATTPTTPRSSQRTSQDVSDAAIAPSSTGQPSPSEEIVTETPSAPRPSEQVQALSSLTSPPDRSVKKSLQPEAGLPPAPATATPTSPTMTTTIEPRPAAPKTPSGEAAVPDSTPTQTTLSTAEPSAGPLTTTHDPLTAMPPLPPVAEHPAPTAAPERIIPHPPEVAPPPLSAQAHSGPGIAEGEGDVRQTATPKPNAQTRAPEPISSRPPLSPEVASSTTPAPLTAATAPAHEEAPAMPPFSPATSTRSGTISATKPPEQMRRRELSQVTPSDEPEPARSTLQAPSSDTSTPLPPAAQTGPTGPAADRPSTPTRSAAVLDRADESPAEEGQSPWMFQNLGFGLGLGWTHNLGPRRVESVTVVNRIVRIDNERNDLVRFMPEMHIWLDRWDEQRWSWGPFLTVAPGSRVIDAVGFGLMLGYRPHRTDRYSFNLGIGGTLDLDARVLGDGLVANESLPPRENTARTKQTTAAGLLVLFSVGWDLSAPYRPAQGNQK
ncbi:MAG: ankyrin repeat domain-containing protein [Nitrospira defluvii]|nr:ankyrin repeat domain-containing protein [Nitrospira defluvii]